MKCFPLSWYRKPQTTAEIQYLIIFSLFTSVCSHDTLLALTVFSQTYSNMNVYLNCANNPYVQTHTC